MISSPVIVSRGSWCYFRSPGLSRLSAHHQRYSTYSILHPHVWWFKDFCRAGCDLANVYFVIDEYTDAAEPEAAARICDIVMDVLNNPSKERKPDDKIGIFIQEWVLVWSIRVNPAETSLQLLAKSPCIDDAPRFLCQPLHQGFWSIYEIYDTRGCRSGEQTSPHRWWLFATPQGDLRRPSDRVVSKLWVGASWQSPLTSGHAKSDTRVHGYSLYHQRKFNVRQSVQANRRLSGHAFLSTWTLPWNCIP